MNDASPRNPAALLQVHDVSVAYGKASVVRGVNLQVMPGEIVALIGANGAGKTTLLNVISRVKQIASGRILFDGQDTAPLQPWDLSRRGLSHVPEGREIFPELLVAENMKVVGHFGGGPRFTVDDVLEIFPRLKVRLGQPAGRLSGGEQQMLAIGRGLITAPRLLLMDEPSLGLSPAYSQLVLRSVKALKERGVSILLVEQNMRAALKIASRAYVMQHGEIVVEGDAAELAGRPDIVEAYLGTSGHAAPAH
ncbi:ABC transporter ATP-binding protein [Variovorax sp.]|jgi:branched-chain amino acid transport system ATP-binding protein|uniref:ABC transporter ATP-binding protein n=1 Tax=Variovorax sp. TaxID=1871043 RepID=UPI000C64D195|nr:ABC transporter ATP-binding protein [Variovorax sp.]MBS80746.1 branched-chain amino acid ABC transporter ATP-binding protein [Variovorax sp.]